MTNSHNWNVSTERQQDQCDAFTEIGRTDGEQASNVPRPCKTDSTAFSLRIGVTRARFTAQTYADARSEVCAWAADKAPAVQECAGTFVKELHMVERDPENEGLRALAAMRFMQIAAVHGQYRDWPCEEIASEEIEAAGSNVRNDLWACAHNDPPHVTLLEGLIADGKALTEAVSRS